MSNSTFSSSSESAFLCSESYSSLNLQGNPLCPFTGHALVYHARVKEPFDSRHRNREKKDNPNCFVKAFRWYTQEHKVQKHRSNDRSDLDDFAAWLDQKYDQFLYDSHRRNAHESRLQVLSSVRIVPKKRCNPFRKCRRTADCRDGGDGCEKCKPSFEVIMQAQEMSRPASECCFQYKAPICCNSSKVTVASSDTVVIKKWSKYKRRSWEFQENELCVTAPEAQVIEVTEKAAITSQNSSLVGETSGQNKDKTPQTIAQCQCPEADVIKTETSTQYHQYKSESIQLTVSTVTNTSRPSQASKSSAQVKPSKEKNTQAKITCLCPKDHVKIDTDTQYSDPEPVPASTFTSCVCAASKLHSNLETKKPSSHQKMRSITQLNTESQYDSVRVKEMCNCTSRNRVHGQKQVCEDAPTMLTCDTAQTSDHAIILDNAAMAGFPLLVRIVTPYT